MKEYVNFLKRGLLFLAAFVIAFVMNDAKAKVWYFRYLVADNTTNSGEYATSIDNGSVRFGEIDPLVCPIPCDSNILWKKNLGGSADDRFLSVTAVSDGIAAVGYAAAASFTTGDWAGAGITAKGSNDAIIVKYDHSGNVLWKNNFGGSGQDFYYSVTAVPDGIVAVGYAGAASFGNGDLTTGAGIAAKGGADAIIVKYDNSGNVLWKNNFGGNNNDYYSSVTAVSDGIVAVGYAYAASFTTGDWIGISAKGNIDAIIVKYDNSGNVLWKKNFGGNDNDYYYSVTAVSDGIVAVGYAEAASFTTGDFASIAAKGNTDAIIVKYDHSGNVLWKNNFGGSGDDGYRSVTVVSDSIIAVGYAPATSFGNGDLTGAGIAAKGSVDAIIVKYDNSGNVVWKNNFGGNGDDSYSSVTAVSDRIVAVGYANVNATGDWTDIAAKGNFDAIIVKYDHSGKVVWKKNFGGSGWNYYQSVTAVSDCIAAVGYATSFGNGDLADMTGKGGTDAIIVKYGCIPTIDTVCFTDSITLAVTVIDGGEAPVYQWFINGVAVDDSNDSIFKYKSSGKDTVQCKVYPNIACGEEAYSQIRVVEMLDSLALEQPDGDAVCVEEMVKKITFTGVYDYVRWEVTTGNGMTIGMPANSGTGDISSFTTVNSGVISITATPVSGKCEGISKTFTITVNPKKKIKAKIKVKF